jgi:hypothetical protein
MSCFKAPCEVTWVTVCMCRCVSFCGDGEVGTGAIGVRDVVLLRERTGACSVQCGGGVRDVLYSCWVRGVGEVAATSCPIAMPTQELCNNGSCIYVYELSVISLSDSTWSSLFTAFVCCPQTAHSVPHDLR